MIMSRSLYWWEYDSGTKLLTGRIVIGSITLILGYKRAGVQEV